MKLSEKELELLDNLSKRGTLNREEVLVYYDLRTKSEAPEPKVKKEKEVEKEVKKEAPKKKETKTKKSYK